MKARLRHATGIVAIALILPAAADVIYSNLQNTAIPTTYTGVTVVVAGGTINPFFGGVGVANNNLLQPLRVGTGSLDAIRNLAVGTSIDASSLSLSTGYGGSVSHLGSTFTAGAEGYLGFQLNGTDYGWMRVVFTNNTGGAVVKDWAYDNSGAAIVVGRVEQSAAVGSAQTVTLSPATGEAFTLGSAVTDTGGNINSVVKTGDGTTTLVGTNSYTGTTAVAAGKLLVNGTVTGGGAVSVAAGATLGGTGSLAGAVTVNGGTLAPGASIESLSTGALTLNTGSTFAYEMNSSAVPSIAGDFQKVFGNLALSGTVNLTLADLAGSPVAFAPATTLSLINYTGTWNGGFFTYDGNVLSDNGVFTAGLNTWQIHYGATSGGLNFAGEYDLTGDSRFINLTAIPEPGAWLAVACLMGSGLCLHSRRR